MVTESSIPQSQKFDRLHQLALTLYRNGQRETALHYWMKIKDEFPEFPDIDEWIDAASRPIHNPKSTPPPSPDPSVFRQQKEMINRAKRGDRIGHTFTPKPGLELPRQYFRHRHIGLIFLIGFFVYLLASFNNNRSVLFKLYPETGRVTYSQGSFFPYGWEKGTELSIGLEPGWEQDLDDPELTNTLIHGLRIKNSGDFDQLLITLYQKLGRKALHVQSIEKQQQAIYYFKKIEKAKYLDLVKDELSQGFLNLATLYWEQNQDIRSAAQYLQIARYYAPSNPGIDHLQEKLSETDQ